MSMGGEASDRLEFEVNGRRAEISRHKAESGKNRRLVTRESQVHTIKAKRR